jgi:hypothetical protein
MTAPTGLAALAVMFDRGRIVGAVVSRSGGAEVVVVGVEVVGVGAVLVGGGDGVVVVVVVVAVVVVAGTNGVTVTVKSTCAAVFPAGSCALQATGVVPTGSTPPEPWSSSSRRRDRSR